MSVTHLPVTVLIAHCQPTSLSGACSSIVLDGCQSSPDTDDVPPSRSAGAYGGPLVRTTAAFEGGRGGFACAVVIPAAGCTCAQVQEVRTQLGPTDCMIVVWNGPHAVDHECSLAVLRSGSAAWLDFPERLGAATARNLGVHWLDGRARMLAFVDADDAVQPGWLSELRAPLADDRYDVVGGALRVTSRGRTCVLEPGVDFWHRQALFGCNCAMTAACWERLGGFSPGVGTCEDTDMAWRAAGAGLRVGVVSEAVVGYALRAGRAEWRQRMTWGRSSVALLRAHGLAPSRHLPGLISLIRHRRSNGFASSPTIAAFGQFAGQWIGRLGDSPSRLARSSRQIQQLRTVSVPGHVRVQSTDETNAG